jgi:hypothetical protein
MRNSWDRSSGKPAFNISGSCTSPFSYEAPAEPALTAAATPQRSGARHPFGLENLLVTLPPAQPDAEFQAPTPRPGSAPTAQLCGSPLALGGGVPLTIQEQKRWYPQPAAMDEEHGETLRAKALHPVSPVLVERSHSFGADRKERAEDCVMATDSDAD